MSRQTNPDKLGQIAYEAYANSTGWKSLATGDPLPQWNVLPSRISKAWINAAAAIYGLAAGMHDWKHGESKAELAIQIQDWRDALEGVMSYAYTGASLHDVNTSEQPQFVKAKKMLKTEPLLHAKAIDNTPCDGGQPLETGEGRS